MFSTLWFQIHRLSAGKGIMVLALVLLPFPVSIPLALWLSRHGKRGDGQPMPPKQAVRAITSDSHFLQVKRRILAAFT